ncbi:MAG TPA: hypothetical protein VGW40_04105 [Allosphingosinicella sp.]|nr:hypothetical protein [Allosphingosinicella sp.]
MLAIQLKAFALLLAVLLLVDALAFQGAYREEYGGRFLHFLGAVSPARWTGFGSGHDWGDQRPRRRN